MLILASQSPRRRELLGCAGIPFAVRPASVDEARVSEEDPGEHVCRLAREKAQSVADRLNRGHELEELKEWLEEETEQEIE